MNRWQTTRILLMIVCSATWRTHGLGAQKASSGGPREMLAVMQIDESQLAFIQDDRPIGDAEQETVMRLLFRLPSFAQVDVQRWTLPLNQPEKLLEDPETARFSLFHVRGVVAAIRRLEVLPELAERLQFDHYYELQIDSGETQSLALVRSIPASWREHLENGKALHGQVVHLHAMLLKRGPVGSSSGLMFAASRVNWHPDQPAPELRVGRDQVLLGQLGVDISRLAEVQHERPMTGLDRECFYQMLAAMRHAETSRLDQLGRQEFDIARMIQSPAEVTGQLYSLRGRARRAVLIHVEDKDIRARFGIEHYYEIEVFLPLKKNVRFTDAQNPEGKLFTDYPFVICVPAIPPEMPVGSDIHVPISFSGFFIKLWAYRTQFMSGDQSRTERPRLQLSPLLIGPTIVPQQGPPTPDPRLGVGIAVFFTISLLAIWLILWRVSVQDRRFSRGKLYQKLDIDPRNLRSLDEK